MLFTWSTENLCIVFSRWRVTGPLSLLGSLVVIVLLAAGYEGIRQVTRQYEVAHTRRLGAFSSAVTGSKHPFFIILFRAVFYIIHLVMSVVGLWPSLCWLTGLKAMRSPRPSRAMRLNLEIKLNLKLQLSTKHSSPTQAHR